MPSDFVMGPASARRAHASFLTMPGSREHALQQRIPDGSDEPSRFLTSERRARKPLVRFLTCFADNPVIVDPNVTDKIHADDIEDLVDPSSALPRLCRRWRISEGLNELWKAPDLWTQPQRWALGEDPPLEKLPKKQRESIAAAVQPLERVINSMAEKMYLPYNADKKMLDQVEKDPAQFFATLSPKYTRILVEIEKVLRDVSHAHMREAKIDAANRWRIQLVTHELAEKAKNLIKEMRRCHKVRPTEEILGGSHFNVRSGMQPNTLTWDFGRNIKAFQ